MNKDTTNWTPSPEGETEVFHFLSYAWDIDKAKKILTKKRRETTTVPLESVKGIVGKPGSISFIAVDWDAAAQKADPTVPLILGTVKPPKRGSKPFVMVLDGHHRIAKAVLDGTLSELPAVLLTEKETRSCSVPLPWLVYGIPIPVNGRSPPTATGIPIPPYVMRWEIGLHKPELSLLLHPLNR